jgi:predicted RNA methylase
MATLTTISAIPTHPSVPTPFMPIPDMTVLFFGPGLGVTASSTNQNSAKLKTKHIIAANKAAPACRHPIVCRQLAQICYKLHYIFSPKTYGTQKKMNPYTIEIQETIQEIMSEKEAEKYLAELLKPFDSADIYYTPTKNPYLKSIFKGASKSGSGCGIPDRIYYNSAKNILIIFECKFADLAKALRDLKKYHCKIKDAVDLKNTIFYVPVVKDNYEIYDDKFEKKDFLLNPKNMGISAAPNYSAAQLEKNIHKIHNYIRDYTKISSEDKSFFIVCILISLKKSSFRQIIDKYDTKKYVYDILRQNLLDFDIDISVFEFLRNDDNNVHFLNLIKMIREIDTDDIDLLSKFYSEFVKYSNSDSRSLGIVLTPPHIVELMIHMLKLRPDDTFLDICAGTGSFPLEASKSGCKLVSCEYQTKLYTLLKCNFILRNLHAAQCSSVHGNCFEHDFKATKSAINPPYGMKDKIELEFVIKQLDSVENGGLVCAIVPATTLNNTKFLQHKKKLLQIATPQIIINLNKDVFYPNAGVQCAIILLKKVPYDASNVLFINYENDGINIEKHVGNVKSKEFYVIYEDLLRAVHTGVASSNAHSTSARIAHDEDWNFHNYNKNVDFSLSRQELKNKLLSLSLAQQKLDVDAELIELPKYRNFFIHEIFAINSVKRTTLKYAKDNPGNVPYISASALNNGITAMTDKVTHGKGCLTIANSGSVGSCFYHTYDICATDSVYVLFLKPCFQRFSRDDLVMCHLASLIEKNKVKYNFGRACRLNKICDDFIPLPSDGRGFPQLEKLRIDLA